jgi:hypothetical protein
MGFALQRVSPGGAQRVEYRHHSQRLPVSLSWTTLLNARVQLYFVFLGPDASEKIYDHHLGISVCRLCC